MADSKTTREQALRVARMLGCQGAHEHPNGWMPCASREEYDAIKKGTEEYLKVRASKKKKPLPKMVQRTKRLETKSDAYYENRADAVAISKARGCGGVRTILLAGKKYYAVCDHKAPKKGWENLDEKPITGIATLPGGGLVTGSFSGKSLGRPIGGVADFDGDGDGFFTGPGGDDNIPVAKLPDVLTTDALKKMRSDVNPDFLDPKKSSERHGDEEFSAAELMKLPAENAYNLSLLDSESTEYLQNQRQINSGGMNQRIRQEGVFYPIILREWADGKRSIHDGHHRLIAAYDNHPDFRVPVFVWKEEGKLGDENKSVEEKGFVNFVSRSTDPDTFSDPESARIRSRNLGCIGIRRYTARDGKLVWLPCTNVSDYNRVTGIRGDNSPRNNPRRQGSKFGKKDIQGSIDQTGLISFKGVPKPKKKPPTVTSGDINDLAVRVRNNNAKAKMTAKTNLRDLKIVFLRGLEDGSKDVAKKRVYKFLALLNSDKPADVKYFDDNDLLPLDHPWRNRKTNKKWAEFREGEYGVKYSKGCCPKVVKRHYSNSLIL